MKRYSIGVLLATFASLGLLRSPRLPAQALGLRPAVAPSRPGIPSTEPAAEDQQEKSAAPKDLAQAPPAAETDPLVVAVLDSNPQTPEELVVAAKVLVSRGRAALARPLVERLAAAQLPPERLRSLARRFGPGTILQLGLAPELAPAGRQFADKVDAAVHAAATDPGRINRLIDQLDAPTLDQRRAAAFQLRDIGPPAVAPLVHVLADPNQAGRHPQVRAALVAMGEQVVPPLLGALETPDPALQAQVISVLGRFEPGAAGPYLLGAAASRSRPPAVRAAAQRALERWAGTAISTDEARRTLELEVRHTFHQRQLPIADASGLATVWRWDVRKGESVPLELPPLRAGDVLAARLAADLAEVEPSEENRRVALVAGLEAFDTVPALGPASAEDLDAALGIALGTQRLRAARALAAALGRTGWAGAVTGRSGQPAPVVLAARAADRRLQRAAVEAALELAPNEPFTGAGAVGETLRFLATGRGERRAVVGHPRMEDGRNLAAWLAARGYESTVVPTGLEAFQAAVASADVELVILHEALGGPCACDVIQQLRRDRRAASVPIGLVLLPRGDRSPLDPFEFDPYSLAGTAPADEAIFTRFLERLLIKAGQGVVPPEVRREQGEFAVAALRRLVEQPRVWFDPRSAEGALLAGLAPGEPRREAIGGLVALGTPAAQRRLAELASDALLPADQRRQALEAFGASLGRHGILLTTAEIQRQYDRYNASGDGPPEDQQILAGLLDALEAPRAAAAQF